MRIALAVAFLAAFAAAPAAQTSDEKVVCEFMSVGMQRLSEDVNLLLLKLERTLNEPMSDSEVARTLQVADAARLKAFPGLIAFSSALADANFQLRVCASK